MRGSSPGNDHSIFFLKAIETISAENSVSNKIDLKAQFLIVEIKEFK